jgi:hypothetical protein
MISVIKVMMSWLMIGNATGTRNPRVNVTGCPVVRVRVAEIVPPKNPYPSHGYDGFDRISNSARKRERLPAKHSKLCISAHHNHQPPRKHEQDSKGGGMGGASTHFLKRYVVIGLLDTIQTNLKLYRIQVVPHIQPPSKTSAHV